VKYDPLCEPGDPENQRFWTEAMLDATSLVLSYVSLEG